ncbi:MAG: ribonuclease P protein component [Candidatus Shapirobacteria bacterium]|nr:ribonuclease P protein component [Candidatus Shapirobacteria bacterium]
MLKKINRIGSRKEFLEIKNQGEIKYSPIFGVLILKKEDNLKKFGFVISKKISKRAVDRNKIKRRLCEVIYKMLDKFEPGIRIVFLVKREILNKKSEEIEKEVVKFIKL